MYPSNDYLITDMERKALIVDNYRYWLSRIWKDPSPGSKPNYVLWIMLNPSTADDIKDDPTLRRIIGFSKRWRYDGLYVCNLYAWIETDSRKLLVDKSIDYIGKHNDQNIRLYHIECNKTIIACGGRAESRRLKEVLDMVKPCYCLGLNKDGSPIHPLYLKNDLEPILYRGGRG